MKIKEIIRTNNIIENKTKEITESKEFRFKRNTKEN
jgi:hypothetical protein